MTEQNCKRCNGLGVLQKRYSNQTVVCPDCYGSVFGRDCEDVPNREPEETVDNYHTRMWKWGKLRAFLESPEGQDFDLLADFEEWQEETKTLYDISDRDDDDDNYDLRGPFASLGPYGNL